MTAAIAAAAAPAAATVVPTLAAATRTALVAAGLDPAAVTRVVRSALEEDLGTEGDLTTGGLVPAGAVADARWVARGPGVIAGMPVLLAVLDLGSATTIRVDSLVPDGAVVAAGDVLARGVAPLALLLRLERTSLNLLGHLSGIATCTAAWIRAVEGTGARIRDTRKTTPGLRDLEKYAVRCGGGVNHRRGLYDGVLVKDNHVVAAGGMPAALRRVVELQRTLPGGVPVQVEVDDLAQLDLVLAAGIPQVLLDNFSLADTAEAVRRARALPHPPLLEASGGLTLERARAVAATGVDLLAVGALTHSAPALDIALDV